MFKRLVLWGVLLVAALLGLIQLVPYGHDHENPPVRMEPAWASEQTRALAVRACFACHSNETEWPWYSNIAPVSWVIKNHVDEGRDELNFSEWDRPQREADESAETILEGEMPLWDYLLFNPEARLSSSENDLLVDGFIAMFGNHEDENWHYDDDDDDD